MGFLIGEIGKLSRSSPTRIQGLKVDVHPTEMTLYSTLRSHYLLLTFLFLFHNDFESLPSSRKCTVRKQLGTLADSGCSGINPCQPVDGTRKGSNGMPIYCGSISSLPVVWGTFPLFLLLVVNKNTCCLKSHCTCPATSLGGKLTGSSEQEGGGMRASATFPPLRCWHALTGSSLTLTQTVISVPCSSNCHSKPCHLNLCLVTFKRLCLPCSPQLLWVEHVDVLSEPSQDEDFLCTQNGPQFGDKCLHNRQR